MSRPHDDGPAQPAGPFRIPDFRIPATRDETDRHTRNMDEASYMVRGRTRDICQRELDRICTLPGIHAASDPTDVMPPGWVARAVLRPASEPASEHA